MWGICQEENGHIGLLSAFSGSFQRGIHGGLCLMLLENYKRAALHDKRMLLFSERLLTILWTATLQSK